MKRILLLVLVSFLIILFSLSCLFYRYTIQNFEQGELMKLQGIANSIALQIDGDMHTMMTEKYRDKDALYSKDQDAFYLELHKVLRANYEANMLKTPIYTLFRENKSPHYYFGVTSQDIPYYRHEYKTFPSVLFEMYATGGTINRYKDEFGSWLSGFSPIKNKTGETVALVMVDEKVENFLAAARKQTFQAMAVASLLFSLMYGVLYYILKEILRKENRDKILLKESNDENTKIKEALEVAYKELNSVNELRKEIIANISHDLRTPIATTMGYLELLKDIPDLSKEAAKNYIEVAYNETDRIKKMVADLFELAKLESGNTKLNLEPINIVELVHDITQKYKLHIEAKHIDLSYKIDPKIPMITGDISAIERVFQNLLDNAVKYVYEGGFILISILDHKDAVKIKVCNQGDLIPESDRPYIFDRYFKSSSKGGTGLGLAIAKKIIELHKGDIRLEVGDQINSFWFSIPKTKVELTL